MRIIEITKTFERNGVKLEGGHKYVMAEDAEAQLRSVVGNNMGMGYPIESVYRKYKGEDLSGKKLMCWRTGGIGDMFFLSPVLVHLKKKYPDCTLKMASGCKQPLENLPEIDELYDMPFDAALLETVDYHLMFQGIIETSNEASKRTHAADMFYSYFSIDSIQFPDEEKKPKLVFTDDEMKWLESEGEKLKIGKDDFVVGIQMETSAPLRNYPKDKMKALVDVLAKEPNVKIFLIGAPQHGQLANFYKGQYENVIPAVGYSVRQALILANRYDLVISPDSFMVQAAGALGKPLIGLYGPFASEVRMKYFKNAVGLDPCVACSPCYKHDFRGCIKGFPSPCFSQVKTEDVLQAADYLYHKTRGEHFGYMQFLMRVPDFSAIEKYMLGADQGLGFFCGYYGHPNMIKVDTNHFVGADITDLSTEFKRESFPFVLYMNDFRQERINTYHGSKKMVRPGGYFIAYKDEAPEQLFLELKQDIGKDFVLLYSKYDPTKKTLLIVGRKNY